jgi:type I restriction enzyme, S subunit
MSLPRGWLRSSFGDVCEFENGDRGKNYSGRNTFVSSGVPMISAGHLVDGLINWEEMNYIPRENFDRLGSGKVKNGDFLFCLRGSVGKFAFVPSIDDGAIASSLVIVRPVDDIPKPFIRYYFRSPLVGEQIGLFENGTAQPNLSSNSLAKFDLPLPPIGEQRRIVAKLDALTTRIARARTELDRVPVLASKLRSATLSTFRRQMQSVPALPIGEVAKSTFDGPFGSNLKSSDYTASGVRVVRLENIGHLHFRADKLSFISEEKYQSLTRHTLLDRDILFSSFVDQDVRVCLFKQQDGQAINKADCFVVRVDPQKFEPQFIAYMLASSETYETMKGNVHGATRPRIGLKQLREYRIPVPPMPEQVRITDAITSAFARADRLEAEAERARKLLDRLESAILAKAFRGELVPQDPNDEPASVLLERIRAERAAAPKQKRGRKATQA